ncbi:sodium:solute symporter family protein [Venenivibrio stagnispumantis]|uniref:Na+/proline symporter n=1 Tax=Venenivibrio stagnispumantis TaxID=407998 RepID=A0AA45WM97_9AQUI|nr:sodium:solute symporter family protein [Venenivibrio stagnispumantis]MCW4572795.1 sodium:solute symporter family protein [Venenivibrio stagnispumantis]SMP13762.1 Na+/proline symporter [Venenivibrio stagnispumantis]
MLGLFIVIYLLITVLIGVYASKFIKSEKDYLLAGRSLPLSLSTFALFALWFGSETILGAPSEFVEKGLIGVIEEPFGAALCLFLAGLLIIKPLYRMNLLTFGDFFKVRYGKKVEIISSFFLIVSYFGWIAAQFVAFGIVFKTITGLNTNLSILIGFFVVVFYTYIGGMWAIALTDFIQTIVIIIGLSFAFYEIYNQIPSISEIFNKLPPDFFRFYPEFNLKDILAYITAWIIIGLGSLPGQDLFQRFMSSKSEKVAVYSSYFAGFMYLTVALIPLFLALFGKFLIPTENQIDLPTIIMQKCSFITQVLFFGALVSAILSTASAAILAPSAILSENILKYLFPSLTDKTLLFITKISVLFVAFLSLIIAFSGSSIYELVASSSVITLVSLFAPFIFGLYSKKVSSKFALISMLSGFISWFVLEFIFKYEFSVLVGFFISNFVILFEIITKKGVNHA